MTNENVKLTASKAEQIETKDGVQKINIVQIPFVPEISIMRVSTNDLAKAVNSTLRPIVDGFMSGRVYTKGGKLGFQICINVNSNLIKKSSLSILGAKNAYSISDELRTKLSPFLAQGEIQTKIVSINRGRQSGMIIELNAKKALIQTLQTPPEGYIYKVELEHVKKNQEALIKVSMLKKPEQHIINKNNNKNKNFNRR